jgi:hypothetical protein
MSQQSSRLAAAFQATLPQFRESESRRTGSGQHWTFSQPGHAVLRSEQRRIQDHLATLSGGSLDQASQEEDEEQEDEEDCLPQAPERGMRISELSQQDLSKVHAAALQDHLATLDDEASQRRNTMTILWST